MHDKEKMNKQLQELLQEILDKDTYEQFLANFEEIKKEKIVSSGISSLDYIMLLSILDEKFSLTDEQIDLLDTIEDLNNIFK